MPARVNPDVAATEMRAAGLEPLSPYPGARVKWPCRCMRCGREVAPQFSSVRGGHGCQWCGRETATRAQRMDHQSAMAVMTARRLEPIEPYPGSSRPWRCRCMTCGAEVTPRYDNIKSGWGGCRSCSTVLTASRRRGPEADAVAAMRTAGMEPQEPYRNVMAPWRSRCMTCGKESTPRLNNIHKGATCKWCAKNAVDPDEAVAIMRAAGLEPLADYPGAHTPWPCRCRICAQRVSPSYGSVRSGSGCRFCNDTTIKPDAAVKLMVRAGLEPIEPYPGSVRKWACRCLTCGRTVRPVYSTIQQGGGGCRWCAEYGFRAAEDAIVYLVQHLAYGAVKVGIADANGTRLKRHARHGWLVLAAVHVPGELAISIEIEILDGWRAGLDLPPYLSKHEMPQSGWTETVDADAIDIPATIARMRALAARTGAAASA